MGYKRNYSRPSDVKPAQTIVSGLVASQNADTGLFGIKVYHYYQKKLSIKA